MTQLANLRSLAKLLPEINSHPTDTPRQRAGKSLLAVLEYLRLAEIQHGALLALSRELSELEGTGRKGVILTASLQARGRGKTGAEIRCAQGVCAGVLELKFRETGSLDEAAKWVIRNIDPSASTRLKSPTERTLISWREKLSPHGEWDDVGREQFQKTIETGKKYGSSDPQLKQVLQAKALFSKNI